MILSKLLWFTMKIFGKYSVFNIEDVDEVLLVGGKAKMPKV